MIQKPNEEAGPAPAGHGSAKASYAEATGPVHVDLGALVDPHHRLAVDDDLPAVAGGLDGVDPQQFTGVVEAGHARGL